MMTVTEKLQKDVVAAGICTGCGACVALDPAGRARMIDTPLGPQPEFAGAKITTRILWLEGLEPGFNRDGNVDSRRRYIYIHGTADQESIGEPASCGCIHLADADLVYLFDRLPAGTRVWIAE